LDGRYDTERQRHPRPPSKRLKTPRSRSAARGFAKKPAVRAARAQIHAGKRTARRKPSGSPKAGTWVVREGSRSGRSAVKRDFLAPLTQGEFERFGSGARGVGRLLHTSGRRILSVRHGGRRKAFGGPAG